MARTTVRYYNSESKIDIATIATEVICSASHVSEGWMLPSSPWYAAQSYILARDIERELAAFNIGYISDERGSWGYVPGGSRIWSNRLS